MVVKMMKWPPWPPSSSKKFEAIMSLKSIEGLDLIKFCEAEKRIFVVEVQWKGPQKGMALGSLRRTTKKNLTREYFLSENENGVLSFDVEEFRNVCGFTGPKDGLFYPWEIAFTVFNGINQGPKSKTIVLGTASLNLTEYVSVNEGKDFNLKIPLIIPCLPLESCPAFNIYLSVLDLGTGPEISETAQSSRTPSPVSPFSFGFSSPPPPPAKDEFSALKASLRKVKTFKDFVSSRKAKKTAREEDGSDSRSDDSPFDVASLDDMAGRESEQSKDDIGIQHSVSYESLASANSAQGSFYYTGDEDEWLVYDSNRRRRHDECCSRTEVLTPAKTAMILSEGMEERLPRSKRGFLLWKKKRKLDFAKALKAKDEPLLKKQYEEDGGDDIDNDRRQFSSSDESSFLPLYEGSAFISEFAEEYFRLGSWESREVRSRDGRMKLRAQVFFASIDQRSERAAGESACTALVAVVADWLQSNGGEMPIKSVFDGLIRDGSAEWRRLCENNHYLERFPDRHFDLETVLDAEIRPLTVSPDQSFVGFFRPEGNIDFLHGAMSFDDIWEEIRAVELPAIYVVSWNDHFFVLKADREAYYLIDTLGERLFEGCDRAYILKFDRETTIRRATEDKAKRPSDDGEVVCEGKESCKEYIKSFLAAIPIRELEVDLKKGLTSSTLVHHRLQIEFHYTKQIEFHYTRPEFVAEFPELEPMDVDP